MAFKAALEADKDAPESWSKYMNVVYNGRKEPSIGSYDPDKLEAKAREVTASTRSAFLYVFGSAGSCSTDRANRKAFERWGFTPKMLVDTSDRNLETTLFGVKYKSPLLLAPIGVHGLLSVHGEIPSCKAAAKVGVPIIMSSASTRSIEDCAAANGDGQRWYQLYWPRNEEITLSLLGRAKKAGFTACVVTLDTMCMGWRPYDLDKSYLPFMHGVGIQVGTSDPAFMATQNLAPRNDERVPFPFDPAVCDAKRELGDEHEKEMKVLGRNWSRQIHSGLFRTWEELEFVRKHWEGPLVLKGILHVDDALKALEVGCDGIVVSNHGGRQVDGTIPALIALEKITAHPRIREAQHSGKFTVLFDSGIRRGADIIKAVAIGAQAVLLGRPYMYGLAISGEQGVEEVIRGLLCEAEIVLGLLGYSSLDQIWDRREEVLERMELGLFSS
ncbi:FMN-dependent alpha-hydroxy acid dehydrogenase [Stereum hirsutum FP-91666 SS1]|uniref:FMN-dependent alpha-hydroxy acid dehydrogenase n=1 Tax=Stereum hirsutum (strain FP-91666) TaxID=721885 RepID=UPI000440B581|nr:FMN-dependent alpha-hydroxy acid dehydrogenase [Stereum hirsutum FP-91666 SS1]EIM87178.1 FMN-dependent alpha-hydroxy acid dehydrogenase [Stereum hirsutum FP-91666 SS1]